MNVLRGGPRVFGNPNLLALIVELNGSGDRYGSADDAVHTEIMRYWFCPLSLRSDDAPAFAIGTFNRHSLNTLYVRDLDATSRIVVSGRKVRVRDEEVLNSPHSPGQRANGGAGQRNREFGRKG